MEEDVMVTTEAPVRNGETPRTFQIRPQQSFLWIVTFQFFLFKGAVKPERLIVVSASYNRDGQRWQQWAQRRTRQEIETPPACKRTNKGHEEGHCRSCASDQTKEGYEEEQARSRASNHKHQRGARSPVGEEGQARSRASDHKHPFPVTAKETVEEYGKKVEYEDRRNTKGEVSASTNTYRTPSQTQHTWHKYSKENKYRTPS